MATVHPSIVPAQVGFLAIYNPSLGGTDETLDDQIVYYSSIDFNQKRRRQRRSRPTENLSQEERNERLRQIGLAQGMVDFGMSFAEDQPVDTIDTDKTRIILHELEPGWWILASIDLTRIETPLAKVPAPIVSPHKSKDKETPPENSVEYSSREVKPAALLLQNLLRAHAIFLLHHDSSLSALFIRNKRLKFTSVLGRYWDTFLSTWNVLLHGNPIRDVVGGIRIAASGELGFGVGEEERGSGEREVFEGLVGRVEGLVDVVVSKFGSSDPEDASVIPGLGAPWLGVANEPGAEDGAIFLGVGALSRKSVRDITYWMEDLYTWGENAYGVLDSPTTTRQRRSSRKANASGRRSSTALTHTPHPLQHITDSSMKARSATFAASPVQPGENKPPKTSADGTTSPKTEEASGGLDKYMDYLKLGYGKYWTIGGDAGSNEPDRSQPSWLEDGPKEDDKDAIRPILERRISKSDDSTGYFLIGLVGNIEDSRVEAPEQRRFADNVEQDDENPRTMLRTVTVELESEGRDRSPSSFTKILGSHYREVSISGNSIDSRTQFANQDANKAKKTRVVVYINKPFILTFIFQLRTESLAFEGFYRSLHHQLAPLRKPLNLSTTYRPERPDTGNVAATIYNLIWDLRAFTVHSTIPNIPDLLVGQNSDKQPVWSRTDALNTHMQMLNIFTSSRSEVNEMERTCKTSRGWWIVWNNIVETQSRGAREGSTTPDGKEGDDGENSDRRSNESSDNGTTPRLSYVTSKEIFLVRKASDHGGGHARSMSMSSSGAGWSDNASRLAQGIGIDTRKYIDSLLSNMV